MATTSDPRPFFCAIGAVRTYKGYAELSRIFAETDLSCDLVIAGAPTDDSETALITDVADSDDRVRAQLGFLSDEDLATLVRRGRGVLVLYPGLENSGVAILALSLGRPIVVPEGPVATELAAEFGWDWVYPVPMPLTADRLTNVLERILSRPLTQWIEAPPMTRRDWGHGGQATSQVYMANMPNSSGAPKRPRRRISAQTGLDE